MKKFLIPAIIVLLIVGAYYLTSSSPATRSMPQDDRLNLSSNMFNMQDGTTPTTKNKQNTSSVAINASNIAGYAYISNSDSTTVSQCQILQGSGALGNCVTTGNGFIAPNGINLILSQNIAYVANGGSNNISLCTINTQTGAFENCKLTGSGFANPSGVIIDNIANYAYISNQDSNSVSRCLVSSNDAGQPHIKLA
jgi:6-phosphogluconolactonase (cycloisomerase 2 family)